MKAEKEKGKTGQRNRVGGEARKAEEEVDKKERRKRAKREEKKRKRVRRRMGRGAKSPSLRTLMKGSRSEGRERFNSLEKCETRGGVGGEAEAGRGGSSGGGREEVGGSLLYERGGKRQRGS